MAAETAERRRSRGIATDRNTRVGRGAPRLGCGPGRADSPAERLALDEHGRGGGLPARRVAGCASTSSRCRTARSRAGCFEPHRAGHLADREAAQRAKGAAPGRSPCIDLPSGGTATWPNGRPGCGRCRWTTVVTLPARSVAVTVNVCAPTVSVESRRRHGADAGVDAGLLVGALVVRLHELVELERRPSFGLAIVDGRLVRVGLERDQRRRPRRGRRRPSRGTGRSGCRS